MLWTFKGYIDNTGVNVFDEWYDSLPPNVQAKIDWIIDLYEPRPRAQWGDKHFKKLAEEIYEMRFEINKICYRPLCGFAPDAGDITILLGVIKKTKISAGEMDTAKNRLSVIKENPERAKTCEFREETEEVNQEIN